MWEFRIYRLYALQALLRKSFSAQVFCNHSYFLSKKSSFFALPLLHIVHYIFFCRKRVAFFILPVALAWIWKAYPSDRWIPNCNVRILTFVQSLWCCVWHFEAKEHSSFAKEFFCPKLRSKISFDSKNKKQSHTRRRHCVCSHSWRFDQHWFHVQIHHSLHWTKCLNYAGVSVVVYIFAFTQARIKLSRQITDEVRAFFRTK